MSAKQSAIGRLVGLKLIITWFKPSSRCLRQNWAMALGAPAQVDLVEELAWGVRVIQQLNEVLVAEGMPVAVLIQVI